MRFKILLFVLLFASCKKEKQSFSTKVIAHAGAGLEVPFNPFPDNSQDAIDFALNYGITSIEVDVQLSLDNQLYLFHDDYLNGKTTHSGCISDKIKSEMDEIRYAYHQNQKISLLQDVDFGHLEELFLDVRHYNPCANSTIDSARLTNSVLSFVQQSKIKNCIVVSNYKPFLKSLMENGVSVCFEASTYTTLLISMKNDEYPMYMIRNKNITVEQVRHIHLYDKKVVIFDVRSHEGNKSALEKKPDYIMTDALESALSLTN